MIRAVFALIWIAIALLCSSSFAQEDTAGYWLDKGNESFERATSAANGTVMEQALQEALQAYDKAVEIDPDNATFLNLKGNTLYQLALFNKDPEKYNESLETFEKVTQINPKFAPAWTGKGTVLAMLGRYNESIDAYDRAIEIDPDSAKAWLMKSEALFELGRYDEALDSINRSIEINPRNADALYMKAGYYGETGRIREALQAFNETLEVDPNKQTPGSGKPISWLAWAAMKRL